MKNQRRKVTLQDIIDAYNEWMDFVDEGAEPLEALHGHMCGPDCWHQQMSDLTARVTAKDKKP